MELPKVGFVEGQGERSYSGGKDRDYSAFANDKGFRYALENQGFDVTKVVMDQQVPEDINIIVISDMREWFTPEQEANLQQYIDRGGNLFILGEPKRRDVTVSYTHLDVYKRQILYRDEEIAGSVE